MHGRDENRRAARIETLTPTWEEYGLLDSGSGKKMERFGEVTLVRPEPQATWRPAQSNDFWKRADGEFVRRGEKRGRDGKWRLANAVPSRWKMRRENLAFWVQPAPSGHVGVFPDQASHWDWIAELIAGRASAHASDGPVEMLSLFGHTGLATLAAAAAGARVTHVDASRKAIQAARENQALSGLLDRPIRWIADDAAVFVAREVKRGRRYDAMLLDPPRFGRGPGGEIWKLDESLPRLLRDCEKLWSDTPLFVILNMYTTVLTRGETEHDAANLARSVSAMVAGRGASIETGDLALVDAGDRKITQSVFARAATRR